MDCYAAGLRRAAAMHESKALQSMLDERYLSWKMDSLGKRIEEGQATLEECAEYAKKEGEPAAVSGRQELFEIVRNRHLYTSN